MATLGTFNRPCVVYPICGRMQRYKDIQPIKGGSAKCGAFDY